LDKNSEHYGFVTTTPKEGWRQFPLLKTIINGIDKKVENLKVSFDTDVNVVAEFEFMNTTHAKENLAYITVGTGIGVGVVIGGKTLHGLVHPEGGHIKVPILKEDADYQGVCGFHGNCLEGLTTNVSIAKRKGLADVSLVANISDDDEVWEKVGYYLGVACANLTLIGSFEKIVIGGGVMNRELLYDVIRKHFLLELNGYI